MTTTTHRWVDYKRNEDILKELQTEYGRLLGKRETCFYTVVNLQITTATMLWHCVRAIRGLLHSMGSLRMNTYIL